MLICQDFHAAPSGVSQCIVFEFIHTNADPEPAVARKRTPGPTPVLPPV